VGEGADAQVLCSASLGYEFEQIGLVHWAGLIKLSDYLQQRYNNDCETSSAYVLSLVSNMFLRAIVVTCFPNWCELCWNN